jgi:hypothetical protein
LRTTPNVATQETPFFLVHGAEAVLPVEITYVAPRIVAYDETTSTEAFQDDIDALDKARDVALARSMQYQQSPRNYHSTRVCPRSFVVGDLVLRLKQDGHGKLESPWLGPYIVTEVIPGGAYQLQDKKTGKVKATHGTQSNFGNFMHKRHCLQGFFSSTYTKTLSCDPLNPEHEAIGRVSWVDSTTCKYALAFSARGLRTSSRYDRSKNNN